jgi:hypothetical protein
MEEITMNVKKKDPQDNSLLVTPAAFYSNNLSDQLVDDLLISAFSAGDAITEMCVICPIRCISEKEQKAPMFDDPFYYE